MGLKVKIDSQDELIVINEDLNGVTWAQAKEVLRNYDLSTENMECMLRTRAKDCTNSRISYLKLNETILDLNADNVLFLSPTKKVNSGCVIDEENYSDDFDGLENMLDDIINSHLCNLGELGVKLEGVREKLIKTKEVFSSVISENDQLQNELNSLKANN